MVLKNTLNGNKIPICRVEDLEITLVSPDFPVKVRLPTKNDHQWRSVSEIRAAEIQCMQLALALLARHESEMYVTSGAERTTANYLQSYSNDEDQRQKSREIVDVRKKHLEDCEKVFGNSTKGKIDDDMYPYQSTEKQSRNSTISRQNRIPKQQSVSSEEPRISTREQPMRIPKHQSTHNASDKLYRSVDRGLTYEDRVEQVDTYNRPRRSIARTTSLATPSDNYRTKPNIN